jgi:hypothetical protein
MACCEYCVGAVFPLDMDCLHADAEHALVMKLGQYIVDGYRVKLRRVADRREVQGKRLVIVKGKEMGCANAINISRRLWICRQPTSWAS